MTSDTPRPFGVEARAAVREAGNERSSLSMAPLSARSEPPRVFSKPPKNAFDCVRHDARSATHTLQGFLDLFASGALGPLSEAQEQSMRHLYQAAGRIHELLDTSIDLAEQTRPQRPSEIANASLWNLTRQVSAALMHEQPGLSLTLEPWPLEELPLQVEPLGFSKVLQCLVELLSENNQGVSINLRFSQTDLHCALTLVANLSVPPPAAESVTQSLPQGLGLSADFEAMAHDFRNRDYLRLKRCEALLARQRGRLMVTPDLSRVRVSLSRR
jgi:hypothetical protein